MGKKRSLSVPENVGRTVKDIYSITELIYLAGEMLLKALVKSQYQGKKITARMPIVTK